MSNDFGIGAQVFVSDASDVDRSPWPSEPSGIISRAGGSAVARVWGKAAIGGRLWWIEFDEPQVNADGEGPFSSAQVLEKYLELAPPID
ncbi:MAG: hypothetical protein JWR53_516 [Glaciihabitans sp.]|jgi:hypothetical protein|nr:hypothetical protein [Glaciihabitans sp.]MCU1534035.1 hypothetical protein [Glaciihabitans sp.]